MTYTVLIPDDLDKDAITTLEKAGLKVVAPGKMNREETLTAIPAADALIIRSGTVADRELIGKGKNLRLIVRAGVGVDNVDQVAATESGVVVENTPGSNTISTAEHAFALMLACARYLPEGHISLKEGKWERKQFVGQELRGKTLGIIGFGRIGRAVAARAVAFEMDVIAYSPSIDPSPVKNADGVEMVALHELYARSDFITIHADLNEKTKAMINATSIAKMKDGVIIINTARGTIFNVQELADAVKSGKVRSVGVDVYDVEPPEISHPLIQLKGVVHTPHLGANTVDAQNAVGLDAAAQVIAGLLKNDFQNVVNPAVLKKLSGADSYSA